MRFQARRRCMLEWAVNVQLGQGPVMAAGFTTCGPALCTIASRMHSRWYTWPQRVMVSDCITHHVHVRGGGEDKRRLRRLPGQLTPGLRQMLHSSPSLVRWRNMRSRLCRPSSPSSLTAFSIHALASSSTPALDDVIDDMCSTCIMQTWTSSNGGRQVSTMSGCGGTRSDSPCLVEELGRHEAAVVAQEAEPSEQGQHVLLQVGRVGQAADNVPEAEQQTACWVRSRFLGIAV